MAEVTNEVPRRHVQHVPTKEENDWRPDLSRERPEWRQAHARQKDASLDVGQDGIYVVKNGDTLYDIARRSLKEQSSPTAEENIDREMIDIIRRNLDAYPGLKDNAHLIHVGDQLRLRGAFVVDAATQISIPPWSPNQSPARVTSDADGRSVTQDPLNPQRIVGQPTLASEVLPPPQLQARPPADILQQVPYEGNPANGLTSTSPGTYDASSRWQYIDREAAIISQMMVNNPHPAADELRNQLQQIDPQSAGYLVAKTKEDEYVGGLGDLQIQVELDQGGRDTGYRNVTMATPGGIEEIAELQAQPGSYNDGNPLGSVTAVIVGDLWWQQQRGLDFNDDRYRGWCNREQWRENYWYSNHDQFVQNWQNSGYRKQYQNQNWKQAAVHPTANSTYLSNNRIDTTGTNRPVNQTAITETIKHTQATNNSAKVSTQGQTRGESDASKTTQLDAKKQEEAERQKAAAAKLKQEQEEAAQKQAAAAKLKQEQEGAAQKQAAAAKLKQEQEEAAQKQAAAAKLKQEQEEAAQKQAAAAKLKQEQEEAAQKQAAVAKLKQEQAEAAQKQAAAAKLKQEQAEAAQKQAAAAKLKQEQEEAAQKQAAAAKLKQEQEEAAQKKAAAAKPK